MKKITFLLVAFIATMFCACSSDDDSLEGTTWITDKKQNEYYEEWEITFEENQYHLSYHYYKESIHAEDPNSKNLEAGGSYSKEENIVSIDWLEHVTDGTLKNVTIQGTINSNTMYFPKLGEFEELVLHKK